MKLYPFYTNTTPQLRSNQAPPLTYLGSNALELMVYLVLNAGTFNEAGVLDLNRRAEPVMSRLGVPMVRAYDITQGQLWATLPEDGR